MLKMYRLLFSRRALKDVQQIKKSGDKVLLKKLNIILKEMQYTPFEGSGQPEALKFELSGYWSRRLDKKNRLVYRVSEEEVEVLIVSAKGHYDDK